MQADKTDQKFVQRGKRSIMLPAIYILPNFLSQGSILLPDDCCLHETLSCNKGFELTHFYVWFSISLCVLVTLVVTSLCYTLLGGLLNPFQLVLQVLALSNVLPLVCYVCMYATGLISCLCLVVPVLAVHMCVRACVRACSACTTSITISMMSCSSCI